MISAGDLTRQVGLANLIGNFMLIPKENLPEAPPPNPTSPINQSEEISEVVLSNLVS